MRHYVVGCVLWEQKYGKMYTKIQEAERDSFGYGSVETQKSVPYKISKGRETKRFLGR